MLWGVNQVEPQPCIPGDPATVLEPAGCQLGVPTLQVAGSQRGWGCLPVMPARKQEVHEFKPSLGNQQTTESNKTKTKNQSGMGVRLRIELSVKVPGSIPRITKPTRNPKAESQGPRLLLSPLSCCGMELPKLHRRHGSRCAQAESGRLPGPGR